MVYFTLMSIRLLVFSYWIALALTGSSSSLALRRMRALASSSLLRMGA